MNGYWRCMLALLLRLEGGEALSSPDDLLVRVGPLVLGRVTAPSPSSA